MNVPGYRPSRLNVILCWGLQLALAGVLVYVAWHKLSGQVASVEIFRRLRLGWAGRYTAALTELLAASLLLVPALVWAGALMGLSVLAGAVFFHVSVLGTDVGDGGLLFRLACIGIMLSIGILYLRLFAAFPGALPGPMILHDQTRAQALQRLRRRRR